MKLSTTTWVSVDGVMQGLGAADEDRRGGFERGGWAMPHANPEVESALNDVYARAAGRPRPQGPTRSPRQSRRLPHHLHHQRRLLLVVVIMLGHRRDIYDR